MSPEEELRKLREQREAANAYRRAYRQRPGVKVRLAELRAQRTGAQATRAKQNRAIVQALADMGGLRMFITPKDGD